MYVPCILAVNCIPFILMYATVHFSCLSTMFGYVCVCRYIVYVCMFCVFVYMFITFLSHGAVMCVIFMNALRLFVFVCLYACRCV